MLTDKFEHFSQICGPCVGYSENQNVTDPEKGITIISLRAWYDHVPHTRIYERENNGGSKWK